MISNFSNHQILVLFLRGTIERIRNVLRPSWGGSSLISHRRHMNMDQSTEPFSAKPAADIETNPFVLISCRPLQRGKVHCVWKWRVLVLWLLPLYLHYYQDIHQLIFLEISHLWKWQCVLHFGSSWHLMMLYLKMPLNCFIKRSSSAWCLPNLLPALVFFLLPCEVCIWTKE